MMYFELLHESKNNWQTLPPGIYAKDVVSVNGVRLSVCCTADRIWLEKDGEVNYVKHRSYLGINYPVDLKEFMFIKLSAKMLD